VAKAWPVPDYAKRIRLRNGNVVCAWCGSDGPCDVCHEHDEPQPCETCRDMRRAKGSDHAPR